jgi:hypothetical protein
MNSETGDLGSLTVRLHFEPSSEESEQQDKQFASSAAVEKLIAAAKDDSTGGKQSTYRLPVVPVAWAATATLSRRQ